MALSSRLVPVVEVHPLIKKRLEPLPANYPNIGDGEKRRFAVVIVSYILPIMDTSE